MEEAPMNATAQTPPASSAQPLPRQEKEKLLQQMYSVPLWIELIRLFAYRTLAMEDARSAIKPLAEQFGKEPVAKASEILVEIFTQDQQAFARLKLHIRRMAFQILGPEPDATETPADTGATPPDPPAVPKKSKPAPKPKKAKRPPAATDSSHLDRLASPVTSIMDQYRAAKEK